MKKKAQDKTRIIRFWLPNWAIEALQFEARVRGMTFHALILKILEGGVKKDMGEEAFKKFKEAQKTQPPS